MRIVNAQGPQHSGESAGANGNQVEANAALQQVEFEFEESLLCSDDYVHVDTSGSGVGCKRSTDGFLN